ncbi:MAG: cell division protein FtsZ, cell division protein FtsZ [Candidatus Paceibacter sp.]|jgi:cell division protein FtsZ|nr:cell division protein FtsZ, cell division protein FtsZ [Candidatus Paceibacter sp.]
MPQIKPEVESFARIKVVGVGGSGKNAVNHMVNSKVKGVEFIAINTDAQDLHNSLAKKKIHIGKNVTRGLGAGMNPELGKRAAEETKEEIQESLKGSDMIFLACGMGGGTGTGAAPVIAKVAKEMGALTVGVVTKPFFFEGQQRMRFAEHGIEELKKSVDAIIVIPNDRILNIIAKDTTAKQAFMMCDEILKQAVEGISDLITTPGVINVDFADIRAILDNAGSALMGIGTASGEKRAEEAAKGAINSPLLDLSIHGAKGVLFSIAGGDDLTMFEIQEAAKMITESVDPNAKIIFGTVRDEKLKKNEIKVTVIASGFPEGGKASSRGSLFREPERVVEAPREVPQQQQPVMERVVERVEKPIQPERGRIYNSITPNPINNPAKEVTPTPRPEEKKDDSDDDDDWGAIPAFLRRSKIK